MISELKRCAWAIGNLQMMKYHDDEWGTPLHDDDKLFEFLVLEGAQAGLSWNTILTKRENYRLAFDHFQPAKVAKYGEREVSRLLSNQGIVRNRLKITSAITNAQRFLEVQAEWGTFDRYIWNFIGGKPIKHSFHSLKELPAKTEVSDAISKDLRTRGFTFVGSTICYAFMQATGIVNDHVVECFRYDAVGR